MTTPDMFSMARPERPKKKKEPPPKATGMRIACAAGCVASLPQFIVTALGNLVCAEEQCATAIETGALSESQHTKIAAIGEQARSWIPELERMRRDIDTLIASGVGKQSEPDLMA